LAAAFFAAALGASSCFWITCTGESCDAPGPGVGAAVPGVAAPGVVVPGAGVGVDGVVVVAAPAAGGGVAGGVVAFCAVAARVSRRLMPAVADSLDLRPFISPPKRAVRLFRSTPRTGSHRHDDACGKSPGWGRRKTLDFEGDEIPGSVT